MRAPKLLSGLLLVGFLAAGVRGASQAGATQVKKEEEEVAEATTRSIGSNSFLQKTVFSKNQRLVFFAGIEGTGHHMWYSAFTFLKEQMGIVDDDCILSDAIFSIDSVPSLTTATTVQDYHASEELVTSRLSLLAKNAEKINAAPILAINPTCARWMTDNGPVTRIGMMSYPNFGGPDKPLQYVDIFMLAQLAEQAELDFRVVYMQRNALDVMVSTTVKRNFGTPVHEGRVLVANMHALNSMMSTIDPAFIYCFDHDNADFKGLSEFLVDKSEPHTQMAIARVLENEFYAFEESEVSEEKLDNSPAYHSFLASLDNITNYTWQKHCQARGGRVPIMNEQEGGRRRV